MVCTPMSVVRCGFDLIGNEGAYCNCNYPNKQIHCREGDSKYWVDNGINESCIDEIVYKKNYKTNNKVFSLIHFRPKLVQGFLFMHFFITGVTDRFFNRLL